MGQSTVPTTGGAPRGSSQECLHHCLSQPSPQKAAETFRRVWALGRLSMPGLSRLRGRDTPARYSSQVTEEGGFVQSLGAACCLTFRLPGALEGKAGTPACPRRPGGPSLPCPSWGTISGEGTPPTRGCSWGPQEGSQGYRATPRGPRRREPPASPPLCHPCSGPHQQQTPGSWSMRRKTGKYSDQREGITVQKKPVQPERAPARLERPTPLRPRRPHPCPLGGKATKAGAGPDWGARAGV